MYKLILGIAYRGQLASDRCVVIRICSHLAKVCAIAKDLMDECERLLHHGTTSEVRGADKVLAQSQQYIRSEQDTTPVVACSMDVDLSNEGELLLLVENLESYLLVR